MRRRSAKRTCSMPRFATTPRFAGAVELLEELERNKIAQFVVREPFRPVGRPVAAERVSQSDQLEAIKEANGIPGRAEPRNPRPRRAGSERLRLKINGLAQECPPLMEFCRLLNLEPGLRGI